MAGKPFRAAIAPSDRVDVYLPEPGGAAAKTLSDHDLLRLVKMRRELGAVDIMVKVYARPTEPDAAAAPPAHSKAWRPLRSARRRITAHSALNAVLFIEKAAAGNLVAGLHFAAPQAWLENFEQQILLKEGHPAT